MYKIKNMTEIIAEFGVNWDGDYEILKKMMENAKKCNCAAIKFQSFNEDIVKGHPEQDRLMKSSVTSENIEKIDVLAKKIGIEWFSTPMFPEAVSLLDQYVNKFKIRSEDGKKVVENKKSEIFDLVNKTGKEIIISTNSNPETSTHYGNPNIKWLYVVPKYPCELKDLDFRMLKKVHGYSNHCPDYLAPLTASILGAKIIELHVTIDHERNFVDNNVSFDFREVKKISDDIKKCEQIQI